MYSNYVYDGYKVFKVSKEALDYVVETNLYRQFIEHYADKSLRYILDNYNWTLLRIVDKSLHDKLYLEIVYMEHNKFHTIYLKYYKETK